MKHLKTIVLVCLALFLPANGTFANEENPAHLSAEKTIKFDFQDVDIHQFIRYVSEMTGYNIVTTPNVKGNITIYSPVEINTAQAFETFIAIMRIHGFAVQKTGGVYSVIPFKDGIQQGETTVGIENSRSPQSIETRIIPLKKAMASELSKILPAILATDYYITSYAGANTLAITAPKSAMETALAFIEQVENSTNNGKTAIIKLKHGNAKTLAAPIATMLKSRDEEMSKRGGISISMVQPDDRTNSLLVFGDDETIETVREIIAEVDIPTPKGKGDIHHVRLANGKAEDIAEVLNTLLERQIASTNAEEEKDIVLSKDVKVVPDKSTNSLVITARSDEFDALLEIIRKLDIERQQVFIEALIMEVNSEASAAFGVNWTLGTDSGDVGIVGGVNLNGGTINLNSNRTATLPSGISLGAILNEAFSIGGTAYNVQSILNMSKGNTDIDVLATPQLLTLDNEEASFEVVDNIPYTKESTASNEATFTTQTMDYKDVGVKLKIVPRINDNGALRLEVEQETSRVTQGLITLSNGDQIVAPTTRKRLIKSTILLKDGQTAVIGGLLDDNSSNQQTEVPGFSKIPVLGWLFKSRQKEKSQTNLFVFITPKIIRSFEESETLTAQKQLILHQTSIGKDGLGLPIISKPKLLPPLMVR